MVGSFSSARTVEDDAAYDAILAAGTAGCPFCDPAPSDLVITSAHHHVVVNLFPYAVWDARHVTDHLMVVPRAHHTMLATMSDEEHRDLFALMREYEPKGYSIYTRSPSNGSRSQAHVHTHLIKTAAYAHATAVPEHLAVVPHTDAA